VPESKQSGIQPQASGQSADGSWLAERADHRCPHSAGTLSDDHVPQLVGLGLVLRLDLARGRLAVPELEAAVQADARDAEISELDRDHVT
jgi:hypothetical protein